MAARPFRFHPAADAELEDAAEWYEGRRSGLGIEFVRAVRRKVEDIRETPERWAIGTSLEMGDLWKGEPLATSISNVGYWSGLAAFTSTVAYDVVQILQVAGMLRFPADEILIY